MHGLKKPAVPDGAFRCQCYFKCLHPQQLRESRRIYGADRVLQWETGGGNQGKKIRVKFMAKMVF